MHPVENKILNDLLDKYENSKLSRGENQRAIHIAFPFNKKTMPKYFDESSLEIETIHAAAEQMEREGLVGNRMEKPEARIYYREACTL